MAIDLYTWGTQQPIYFKLTLNGVGQAGLTLQANDIKVKRITGGAGTWVNASTIGTIADEGNGWYSWTPLATTNTQYEEMVFNIKDDVGTAFDENGSVVITGGNVLARLDGV